MTPSSSLKNTFGIFGYSLTVKTAVRKAVQELVWPSNDIDDHDSCLAFPLRLLQVSPAVFLRSVHHPDNSVLVPLVRS